jgi:hypothetical protein
MLPTMRIANDSLVVENCSTIRGKQPVTRVASSMRSTRIPALLVMNCM